LIRWRIAIGQCLHGCGKSIVLRSVAQFPLHAYSHLLQEGVAAY
jgi:hypothetical protein